MAKRRKKSSSRRKVRRNSKRCRVERSKGFKRMVCRDAKGRIRKSHKIGRKTAKRGTRRVRRSASSAAPRRVRRSSTRKGRLVCPKKFAGKKVQSRAGRCYIVRDTGAWRFVKKVHARR